MPPLLSRPFSHRARRALFLCHHLACHFSSSTPFAAVITAITITTTAITTAAMPHDQNAGSASVATGSHQSCSVRGIPNPPNATRQQPPPLVLNGTLRFPTVLNGTSTVPQRNLKGTSKESQRNLKGTSTEPQRNLNGTSTEPQ